MFEYYREQPHLPTFAGFREDGEFAAYQAMRERVLRDRLGLPPAMFRGAEVLEFGPDSGENAVVFARWGANLTLVEPNPNAHAAIRANFGRFASERALRTIESADVLGYRDARRYDVVVAEGFIYTVKPTRAWLRAFRRLLVDDGFFVVAFLERFGGLIELAQRALHQTFRRQLQLDAATAATRLFAAKWGTIAHTRRFESWVMDVLENPFIRPASCIGADELVGELYDEGFALYTSYPHYDDVLAVDWHKRNAPAAEWVERARAHVRGSVLSFVSGRKLFVGEPHRAATLTARAERLVELVDRTIEGDDAAASAEIADGFAELAAAAREPLVVADGADARADAAAILDALSAAFGCVARAEWTALETLVTSSPAYLAAWGTPTHFVVGRALPGTLPQ